ncbi:hypothetical protein NKG94_43885 [Micromonospora sp. M12]
MRDLAAFALHTITEGSSGAFNVCAPMDGATFGGLLADCAHATRVTPPSTGCPMRCCSTKASGSGPSCPSGGRSTVCGASTPPERRQPACAVGLSLTVHDTWRWMVENDEVSNHDRAAEIGISREKEAQVLAAWHRSGERTG